MNLSKAPELPASWERPATASTEIERPGTKAKILVADDNEMSAMALEDYLTAAGYELYFAADGEQAVARRRKWCPI